MRRYCLFAALLLLAVAAIAAPAVRTRTYFVTGMKEQADVDAVGEAVRKLPSVTKVSTRVNTDNGVTNSTVSATFDTHQLSHGQVGYAIMDAGRSLGKRFRVATRFRVPQYARDDNAAAVDAIIARQSRLAEIRPLDRDRGLFEARLRRFDVDPSKTGPQGFHMGELLHPIHDPKPRGLGLDFQFIGPDDKPDPLE